MKNNTPREILEKIKSSNKILLSLHDGPDGDSLGSCTAMKYFLERDLKKEVKLISPSDLNESLSLFDFAKEVEFGKRVDDLQKDFDLLIMLDFCDPKYYSEKDDFKFKIPVIDIDHHESNPFYGELNYVWPEKRSTCSIIVDLFKEWNVNFDEELSTRLLLGLYTDSLNLSLGTDALKEAVFLTDNGADYDKIVNIINYNDPLRLYKYFALLIKNFKIVDYEGVKIGVSAVSVDDLREWGLTFRDVRLGPNYLQHLGGIDFLFTLADMGDFIKGSFRTTKKVDTSSIAEELGGGGHKFASAFRFEGISLNDAEKKVFDAIKKVGVHRVD